MIIRILGVHCWWCTRQSQRFLTYIQHKPLGEGANRSRQVANEIQGVQKHFTNESSWVPQSGRHIMWEWTCDIMPRLKPETEPDRARCFPETAVAAAGLLAQPDVRWRYISMLHPNETFSISDHQRNNTEDKNGVNRYMSAKIYC